MIRSEDVGYHTPENVTYDWAETSFFSIYLPEPNLVAWVYLVARPGVGAMVCDVEVIDRIGRISLEARYADFQQHLPLPERFESFTLPNGLTLEAKDERTYRIDYVGVDDTELHWDVRGLMEPFDIHDQGMDPLASHDPNASGFGAAYANHFDMTAQVTGTIKVRGKSYDVDCVTTMDHSWGPRGERGMRSMGWINANFGTDLAFQTIWSFDPLAIGWDQFKLAHGYALIDGRVRGLTAGRIRAIRPGGKKVFPGGYEAVLTDLDGAEYRLVGTVVAQQPWACYSCSMPILSLVRWTYKDREGSGQAQENWPLDSLTGQGFEP
ncbi:DUF7065 domain-containing protein [Sphingomonas sp. ID0503]|uniref:DUF7065 domain-containing protein n=1 Tax=Sphingomonas sp. ID0503 TaxID=3399691 RepID=UPI003AFB0854